MNFQRFIQTFLLLCTYSLSFAQGLLPHSHDWQNGFGNEEHHHHAHSAHTSTEKESHVMHGSHCDDGLYDLILCYLSDLDNPEKDTKPELNQAFDKYQNVLRQIGFTAVVLSFIPLPETRECIFIPQGERVPKEIFVSSTNQRGPPINS